MYAIMLQITYTVYWEQGVHLAGQIPAFLFIRISNNQRLQSAGNNDQQSKHLLSIPLCLVTVRFM